MTLTKQKDYNNITKENCTQEEQRETEWGMQKQDNLGKCWMVEKLTYVG